MFRIAEDVVRRDAVIPRFLAEDQHGRPHPKLLADLRTQLDERLDQDRRGPGRCHGDACLPNFMIDPGTLAPASSTSAGWAPRTGTPRVTLLVGRSGTG